MTLGRPPCTTRFVPPTCPPLTSYSLWIQSWCAEASFHHVREGRSCRRADGGRRALDRRRRALEYTAKVERTREVESRDREHEWRQTRLLRTGAAPFCCHFHLFMHVLYMSLRLSIPTTTQSLHGAPLSSERPCDMHGRQRRGENQSSRERS